ncbi:hypothetical protein [Bradyrhizobium sp. STM 3557]|uniref:hypothetical protein n=1 Tax=Bradyrhizobium sp. STM 3557 TaxID=578920 RepID=UPI0038910DE4
MRRQLILFSSVVASLVLTGQQVAAGEFVFEPTPASAERIDPDKLSEVEVPSWT